MKIVVISFQTYEAGVITLQNNSEVQFVDGETIMFLFPMGSLEQLHVVCHSFDIHIHGVS